ncbi:Hpt domain-containing protein [Massilia sp. RP-1-19]|uniref:Hpt domain-containing protein n=1 Tax=Massilia polaris TaxID=2728846 RepID=A0A848HKH2_9BURK|nr:Hpt domain-containing protein [Massilia polaris]NML60690.1 Hpt domain-containing protein [Massilia polaris]
MTEDHIPSTIERRADAAAREVVDVGDGIDRVMGDRDLYARMLRRFRKDYSDGDRPIRVALTAGDRALAHRLSHTLKGAAGMIGARPLHLLACDLETALRTASGEETACLDALTPALSQVIAILDTLLNEAVPMTAHATQPNAAMADPALLARLLDLLISGDGAAIDLLDDSEAGLRMILGDAQFDEVVLAANEFDYDRALGALRRLGHAS